MIHVLSRAVRSAGLCIALLATAAGSVAAGPPTTQPDGRTVRLAEGVYINWRLHQVELGAEVVLREGYLELLACSRNTKEHESILRIRGRPLHVYQALGMLGLPDGRPPYFDDRARRVVPPRGTPIDVHLRYEQDGRTREVNATDWLVRKDEPRGLSGAKWYFIASASSEGRRFPADVYGTVLTVVQFGSGIVMFAPQGAVRPLAHATQTAGGRLLEDETHLSEPGEWVLLAATEKIPPLHTAVTVVLRPSRDVSTREREATTNRSVHP